LAFGSITSFVEFCAVFCGGLSAQLHSKLWSGGALIGLAERKHMKKQHALSEQYFERLGRLVQILLDRLEARRKRKAVRAYYLNAGDLSAHIRKDIGLDHANDRHNLR
jgi:hypothetical protein